MRIYSLQEAIEMSRRGEECWVPVDNFPDAPWLKKYFKVSNLGNLRRAEVDDRANVTGWKPMVQVGLVGGDYVATNFTVAGTAFPQKNATRHVVVLRSFVGPPKPTDTGDHINRRKEDNRLCNVRWSPPDEQQKNKGPCGRISEETDAEIKKRIRGGGMDHHIARELGVARVSVQKRRREIGIPSPLSGKRGVKPGTGSAVAKRTYSTARVKRAA
jgi:hypothetical protein